MRKFIHYYRIEFFLITLLLILFGSLIFPIKMFDSYIFPLFFLLNIGTGINLISKKYSRYLLIALFTIGAGIFLFSLSKEENNSSIEYGKFVIYFLFYVITTYEIIIQIWYGKEVNKDLLIGVISGYITLGLVGFFIFMAIEMSAPGSFGGELLQGKHFKQNIDSLLYYSYITLTTIGYGEITPLTAIAQKSAILLGLMGQFYIVIVTAIVVGKFNTKIR